MNQILKLIAWPISILTGLLGLAFVFVLPVTGVCFVIAGLFINPLSYKFAKNNLKNYSKFVLNPYLSSLVAVVLMFIGFGVYASSNNLLSKQAKPAVLGVSEEAKQ